ncbi:MAG: polyprenyl synthetase family protein [Clostridia bacterium]|nr:polyprenyl synthetase family protein [Clostridia bacterium]
MSFFDTLSKTASDIEARLLTLLSANGGAERLNESVRYSALNGGKRLRAYLARAFCELCGEEGIRALDYGCAIEMIHAFSLIHDDLPAMDNDDMRRGRPSNHIAFGEATAILAGDSLALDAFAVAGLNPYCESAQNAEAMILLSQKAGRLGMCGGQQIDIDGEGKGLDINELTRLVDLKTGALFSCACALGCIAANASEAQKQAAIDFGLLTGRAFQITDDLLDISSTPEELGKSIGKDMESEKSTFVSLLGEERAYKYAGECIACAKSKLAEFGDNVSKTELYEFCDYILIRKK